MDIRLIPNDGEHFSQQQNIRSFFTPQGYVTPQKVWVGMSKDGVEVVGLTKEECFAAIQRMNNLLE